MKNTMKRILSLLFTVMMFISIIPMSNINAEDAVSVVSSVSLEGMPIVDHGSYQGNQGDSTIYNLNGKGLSRYNEGKYFNTYGNVGFDGTEYSNGFEAWLARWNFRKEISWAYATFDLGGKYKTLTGKINLINTYSWEEFNTTVYFYDKDNLLASYIITNNDYIKDINVNVSGVEHLKLLVQDNIAAKGGTSFALHDMFLHDSHIIAPGTSVFSAGYNFDRDRYNFENPTENVSREIFEDVFGDEKGELIYNKQEKGRDPHGICYGMAATTGSLFLDIPAINSFIRYIGPCNYISDINEETKCFELNTITALDFIKYGYVTQYSPQAEQILGDCSAIYNAVYDYIYNNGLPVIIVFEEQQYDKEKKEWNSTFAHAVLAIGLEGDNGIIIDDSNKETKETIYFTRDANGNFTNEWTYSGYPETTNGTNIFDKSIGTARRIGYIGGNTAVALPYLVLAGNAQLDGYPDSAYEDASHKADIQATQIDTEYNLLSISSDSYNIISDDNCLLELNNPAMGEIRSDKNNSLYWIHNNSGITVSNFESDNNEVIVATNDIALEVVVCKDSTVKMKTIDKTKNLKAEIDVVFGQEYSITLDTSDVNGNDVDIIITGTASGSEITATQTETGLLVTGISDGTVTLTKDDEVIATQEINDAVSDIEIIYDKNGESEEVEVDYHAHSYTSTVTAPTCTKNGYTTYTCECGLSYTADETAVIDHADANADGFCDSCGYDNTKNCSHLCHKTGFMGFIWKILLFIFKLFKISPVCDCGVAHY